VKKIRSTRKELCSVVAAIFTKAERLLLSKQYIEDELREVRKELSAKQPKGRPAYSKYDIGYIEGVIQVHFDNLIAYNLVEYCYMYNNVLYSKDKESVHGHVSLLENEGIYEEDHEHLYLDLYWRDTFVKYDR